MVWLSLESLLSMWSYSSKLTSPPSLKTKQPDRAVILHYIPVLLTLRPWRTLCRRVPVGLSPRCCAKWQTWNIRSLPASRVVQWCACVCVCARVRRKYIRLRKGQICHSTQGRDMISWSAAYKALHNTECMHAKCPYYSVVYMQSSAFISALYA